MVTARGIRTAKIFETKSVYFYITGILYKEKGEWLQGSGRVKGNPGRTDAEHSARLGTCVSMVIFELIAGRAERSVMVLPNSVTSAILKLMTSSIAVPLAFAMT